MSEPLLLCAFTTHKGSLWSEEQFEKDYAENHLPRIVLGLGGSNSESGGDARPIRTGLRYKNANPAGARATMLALYTIPDPARMNLLHSADAQALAAEHAAAQVPGDVFVYEKMQTFEGPFLARRAEEGSGAPRSSVQARFVTSIVLEPAEDGHEDADDWYRRQHLDMLSMVPGYRRTTRWRRTSTVHASGLSAPAPGASYLVLHEWEAPPPQELLAITTATEWARRVVGGARFVERQFWELAQAEGDVERRL